MKRIANLTLVLLALGATTAAAQNNANIQATATVEQPITVTGTQALDFATVFPGVNKIVAVTDPTAGLFHILGQGGATVNLDLTLPANLANGGNNLTIGSWTGYKNNSNSATIGGTAFAPTSGPNGTLVLAAIGGDGFVFLGATVTPTLAQAAGNYSNTITLTVTY